jgi:secernin
MCDTAVVVESGRVLFAKNSDRDPNEAQLLEWHPRRVHPAGATVRCTWIEIPQARETHAVLLSRPFWMVGAEIGANEHGVVIGNEAVFTRQPYARAGLTGMDLLRLALERTAIAREAVALLEELLATFGQGGGCGHENRRFAYHNSFLVADPRGAFVLETAGRHTAVEAVRGARTISNGLTIPEFRARHADRLSEWGSRCRPRRARTSALAGAATGPGDLMRMLRDHGDRGAPDYELLVGAFRAPCAHHGGVVSASTQTTASWVSELTPDAIRHWATGTAAPCTGLFKPVRVDLPLKIGPPPTDRADGQSLWWRHERLHRAALRDPERLLPLFAGERDAVEARWLRDPPDPVAAFAEGDRLLARWTAAVEAAGGPDRRPWWVRRSWRVRDRRAGRAA